LGVERVVDDAPVQSDVAARQIVFVHFGGLICYGWVK
jgi:hypothetical protein